MTLVIASFTKNFAARLAAALIVAAISQVAVAQEAPKNFILHIEPKPVPEVKFEDRQGRTGSLAEFKGKVVLLNIWATWCVSCRLEMPALDGLQAALGGADFEVVALSIDRGGIESVAKFYAGNGVTHLAMYIDTSGKVLRELDAVGLPTTLIINRGGQEIGRIIGPVAWDEPEITELVRRIIAKYGDAIADIRGSEQSRATQKDSSPNSLVRGFQWLKALFIR